MNKFAILGVGNILEKDDGIAIYATRYLEKNYDFQPNIHIENGGVEGINLLNFFMEHQNILILDAIEVDDKPGSIYHIPSDKLTGFGLNSGGAHEIGVLQCIDILELMGNPLPESSVLGIVPEHIDIHIGLSSTLEATFSTYINTVVSIMQQKGVLAKRRPLETTLLEIIDDLKYPTSL